MKEITPRTEEVYQYLLSRAKRIADTTHRDICEHFGWKSTNAAARHLRALEESGAIRRNGRRIEV